MKKPSKTQISLINTVEDLIYSNLFKKIMSTGTVPLKNADIDFGKWEFNNGIPDFNIGVPPQFHLTLDEAEILKIIDEQLCLTQFYSKEINIKTNKEELFNFLLYVIRQSRGY
jgi:hypothetical protein